MLAEVQAAGGGGDGGGDGGPSSSGTIPAATPSTLPPPPYGVAERGAALRQALAANLEGLDAIRRGLGGSTSGAGHSGAGEVGSSGPAPTGVQPPRLPPSPPGAVQAVSPRFASSLAVCSDDELFVAVGGAPSSASSSPGDGGVWGMGGGSGAGLRPHPGPSPLARAPPVVPGPPGGPDDDWLFGTKRVTAADLLAHDVSLHGTCRAAPQAGGAEEDGSGGGDACPTAGGSGTAGGAAPPASPRPRITFSNALPPVDHGS